jgi:dTDP-glucose 4,6-dehydratase
MTRVSKARVLITGAGGFIGSHLSELCLREAAHVRAFVRYNSRNDWGMLEDLPIEKRHEIEVVAGDLRDPDAIRRAVHGCNIVFHLGALIGIPYSYVNPVDVVNTNVLGTLHVLQACLEHRVERIIHTSTSEVYGTAKSVPMDEDHPQKPQSPYAASKVGADKLVDSFHRTYGLPILILRPFNAYGPRQSPRAVIPTIITQALASGTVRLGSLRPRRDLTYVKDVARGFLAAAGGSKKCVGETFHLGSQRETSVAELVRLVGNRMGKKLEIVAESRRRRPKNSEVQRLLASCQKTHRMLRWQPEVSLEEGLDQSIAWYRSHTDTFKHQFYQI